MQPILTLDSMLKLFGYLNKTSYAEALNTILTFRYYIYNKSRNQGTLLLTEFNRLLKRIYLEQELLSKLDNKHEVFVKKWCLLKN